MSVEDQLPTYLGARAIAIYLSAETPTPSEGHPFIVEFGYGDAELALGSREGLMLPLVLQLFAPNGRIVFERVFDEVLPDSADVIADEGGAFLLRFAERFHNRWFGSLIVYVKGDDPEKGS